MSEREDREAILETLHRYTRGVDRLDDELILSVYHPDAIDYHGTFRGSPTEFVAWLHKSHENRVTTQHFLSNFTFDFDGDTAHVESYFFVPIRNKDSPNIDYVSGRYADKFEKRDGEWKIAVRVVVTESIGRAGFLPVDPIGDIGVRDRTDVSYARPLEGAPPPQHR